MKTPLLIVLSLFAWVANAQCHPPTLFSDHEFHDEPWIVIEKLDHPDTFRQLDEILPTPDEIRLASGAPGPDYWQQQVDYDIKVQLDETTRTLHGQERITYHNKSPHELRYLWLQLDQNRFRRDSLANRSSGAPDFTEEQSVRSMRQHLALREWEGGCDIHRVARPDGSALEHSVVDTVMRIELPEPLKAGEIFVFDIDWSHPVVRNTTRRARSSYELFDDGHALYEIAQWFPRLCPYTDGDGWQNKAFLGSSEFATEFGDYTVAITVPDTHVVASTGVLGNPEDVLDDLQRERLQASMTAKEPVLVITPDEALANEKIVAQGTSTWIFDAENVRDFAWASSPTFAWDAWGVEIPGSDRVTLAMSYFPVEGEPLWSRYSTQSVAHALEMYSYFTMPYPYPVAISVNGPVGGMEYPMICFNGPRPEADGTYSERTKWGLIGVIIHEVGHNWFPMIINSDERQWTWMDEGLNSFLEFQAEMLWDKNFPARRGEPKDIVDYMVSQDQVPLMTQSDSVIQFGPNGYTKPATALVILRETVMGRELFDRAFKEYANLWRFKRPTPYDFFRTMEESSGIDLDWFWRGWFYSTDHVDIALNNIHLASLDTLDPQVNLAKDRVDFENEPLILHDQRNEAAKIETRVTERPELLDIYNEYDEFTPSDREMRDSKEVLDDLYDKNDSDPEWKKKALVEAIEKDEDYYIFEFSNKGGLVMPIPLEITYEDGAKELIRIPVEVWRKNSNKTKWLKRSKLKITQAVIDPYWEIGDTQIENNYYPTRLIPTRLKPRASRSNPKNLMQDLLKRNQVISSHQ